MWRHTELVYERSQHEGVTHQVLANIAHRAHPDTHRAMISHARIAADCRISERSVTRAIDTLIEAGDIILILKGNGRGYASEFGMGQQYIKGDTQSTFIEEKGDTVSPLEPEKVDMVSVKVDTVSIKGDTVSTQGIREGIKKAKSKNPPNPPRGEPIPPELDTSEFRDVWERWHQYRREIRKPLKPTTVKAQLKKLAGWGESKAIQALENSITNTWTGIFEPDPVKANGHGRAPAATNGQYQPVEAVRRQNNDAALERALAAVGGSNG